MYSLLLKRQNVLVVNLYRPLTVGGKIHNVITKMFMCAMLYWHLCSPGVVSAGHLSTLIVTKHMWRQTARFGPMTSNNFLTCVRKTATSFWVWRSNRWTRLSSNTTTTTARNNISLSEYTHHLVTSMAVDFMVRGCQIDGALWFVTWERPVDWALTNNKNTMAFCGSKSDAMSVKDGVLQNECFVDVLNIIPHATLSLIGIFIVTVWNHSVMGKLKAKTWVHFQVSPTLVWVWVDLEYMS